MKIVIIGAGSLVFSSRLTADLLSYPKLQKAHFALVDTDIERLDYALLTIVKMMQLRARSERLRWIRVEQFEKLTSICLTFLRHHVRIAPTGIPFYFDVRSD